MRLHRQHERERRRLSTELAELKPLLPLLRKRRRGEAWTPEERTAVRAHLRRRVADISQVTAAVREANAAIDQVLLALVALGDGDLRATDPIVIDAVVGAFSYVGLMDPARNLAIEAAGGMADPPGAIGTDMAVVMAAIERAASPGGGIGLMDLGRAGLSGEMAASGPCPAPMSSRTWGLPGALSEIETTAVSGPTTEGVKPTSNEHCGAEPGLISVPIQAPWPLREKSAAFAPRMRMSEIVNAASPPLRTATGWGAFIVPTGTGGKLTLPRLK